MRRLVNILLVRDRLVYSGKKHVHMYIRTRIRPLTALRSMYNLLRITTSLYFTKMVCMN